MIDGRQAWALSALSKLNDAQFDRLSQIWQSRNCIFRFDGNTNF